MCVCVGGGGGGGGVRTVTSTLRQLLSSVLVPNSMLLYVHRNHNITRE